MNQIGRFVEETISSNSDLSNDFFQSQSKNNNQKLMKGMKIGKFTIDYIPKEEKFLKLFLTLFFYNERFNLKRSISRSDLARESGISETNVKRITKSLKQLGLITIIKTIYIPGTKIPGINIYKLTKTGRALLDKYIDILLKTGALKEDPRAIKIVSDRLTRTNFSKEKYAIHKQLEDLFKQKLPINKTPDWWETDKTAFQKAIKLLKTKLKHGFKVKNVFKFITHLIKNECRGFKYHESKIYSGYFSGDMESMLTIAETDPSDVVKEGLEAVALLKKKGLDTSQPSMQKLLRNRFSMLADCAKVLLKILNYIKIDNLNAFLNWMISKSNPYELLKPNVI